MDDEVTALPQGIEPGIEGYKFVNGKWGKSVLSLPKEMAFTIYVNTLELVTILCTPNKLNCLVLGYLFAEGIIDNVDDVASMRVCEEDATADVKLKRSDFKLPEKRVLTSGCGGGVSFNADINPIKIESDVEINPEEVLRLMKAEVSIPRRFRTVRGCWQ
jgi:FdhD protein